MRAGEAPLHVYSTGRHRVPLAPIDTGLGAARRWINGRPIFSADTNHFHHQLVARGFTVKQTVMISYVLASFFGLLGAAMVFIRARYDVAVYLVVFGLPSWPPTRRAWSISAPPSSAAAANLATRWATKPAPTPAPTPTGTPTRARLHRRPGPADQSRRRPGNPPGSPAEAAEESSGPRRPRRSLVDPATIRRPTPPPGPRRNQGSRDRIATHLLTPPIESDPYLRPQPLQVRSARVTLMTPLRI
jgi:hypothetical protein